jgi:hypothetical protein
MKQDRFLVGILIFIALLVAAALALFFIRREQGATYLPEDTPAGVVYDYVLAIQRQDLDRAYGYLADLPDKPSVAGFRQAALQGTMGASASAQVGEVNLIGEDNASVMVTIHFLSSGPFDTGWDSNENATLVRQQGAWKISYMPYPYWSYDWFQPLPESVKP